MGEGVDILIWLGFPGVFFFGSMIKKFVFEIESNYS